MDAFIRGELEELLKAGSLSVEDVEDVVARAKVSAIIGDAGEDDESLTVLFVDGSCNGKSGGKAWATVTDSRGNDIVPQFEELYMDYELEEVDCPKGKRTVALAAFKDVKSQQNNGAELLAMNMALRIAQSNEVVQTICSDSDLVVSWWSKGHVSAKTKETMDVDKRRCVDQCKQLRKEFDGRGGKVLHVPGGSNPADFGFHKPSSEKTKK